MTAPRYPFVLPALALLFVSTTSAGAQPLELCVHQNNGQVVAPDVPLIAEMLARHGYVTRAVTSLATMWPVAPERGVDRGFGTYVRGVRPEDHALRAKRPTPDYSDLTVRRRSR